jgi:hypothetical protein
LNILWDILFLDGSIVLFKAAIGILKSIKKEIMKETCIEKIQNIIEIEANNFLDSSTLIYYLLLRRYEFKIDYINKNRNIYEEIIIDSFFKTSQQKLLEEKNKILEEGKIHKLKRDEIKKNSFVSNFECQIEWPLCIFDTYYKHDITNYFIFKTFFEPCLIDDFYYSKYENYSKSANLLGEDNKDILDNEEILLPPFRHISPKFTSNFKDIFILPNNTPKKIRSCNINKINKSPNKSFESDCIKKISSDKEGDLKFNRINSVKKERGRSHTPVNFYKAPKSIYKNSNKRIFNNSLKSVKSEKVNIRGEEFSALPSDNNSKLTLNEEGFSLIIEKNEDLSFYKEENSSGYDLENILIQSCEVENLNFYGEEEIKRLNIFENILIERRPHFCTMVEDENLDKVKIIENIEEKIHDPTFKNISISDESYQEESLEKHNMSINSIKLHKKLKNQRYSLNIYNNFRENNYNKNLVDFEKSRKREDSIKSFNEMHPYFSKQGGKYELAKNKQLDNLVIGSMISNLKKSISLSEKDQNLLDISLKINPFKEENENLSDLEEKDKNDHFVNELELENFFSPRSPGN